MRRAWVGIKEGHGGKWLVPHEHRTRWLALGGRILRDATPEDGASPNGRPCTLVLAQRTAAARTLEQIGTTAPRGTFPQPSTAGGGGADVSAELELEPEHKPVRKRARGVR